MNRFLIKKTNIMKAYGKKLINKSFLFLLILVVQSFHSKSQIVVNGYAKVSTISGVSFTVSVVDQTGQNFAVGEEVIIMQMQDDVIGSNTGDVLSFGDIAGIASAGLYERRTITAIDGVSTSGYTTSSPTSISVNSIVNSYHTCPNCSVQLITYTKLSSSDYTTSSPIRALDWNGNIGGVVAFQVPGTLFLNHSITADSQGFRGGATSTNFYSGTTCASTPYITNSSDQGYKGEGIYKSIDPNFSNGRGKITNGGGGGLDHNAGGGGGGNYTAGGSGGSGWNGGSGCSSPGGGGIGGVALTSFINSSRIFMGGGGGGGQQNDNIGTSGGTGGGIVFISANTIDVASPCSGIRISADGADATNPGSDGGGGGGGGGSIVLSVANWIVASGCTLIVNANGGNGGNVNSPGAHGGGGGGGQGVVITSVFPPSNVTTETDNGTPGCNITPCTSSADPLDGSDGDGIITEPINPLPIEMKDFFVSVIGNKVNLLWITESEQNSKQFNVYRSGDLEEWELFYECPAAGSSVEEKSYSTYDLSPNEGINYYKLELIDQDGSARFADMRSVLFHNKQYNIIIYPNPASGNEVSVIFPDEVQMMDVTLLSIQDALGNYIDFTSNKISPFEYKIQLDSVATGVYYLKIDNSVIKFIFLP